MRIDRKCRWVRCRLPLLAGGEVAVEERRRIERHLIGCPGCRDHRDVSTDALTALRTLAEVSPAKADAPSLWPALALQIRESRHVAPELPWWEVPLPSPWGAFALAMGLGAVLTAAFLQSPGLREETPAPAVAIEPSEFEPEVIEAPPVVVVSRRGALPGGPGRTGGALPQQGGSNPVEPPSSLQFNYDLDHMTPMTSSNRDPQHSY